MELGAEQRVNLDEFAQLCADLKEAMAAVFDYTLRVASEAAQHEGGDRLMAEMLGQSTYWVHTHEIMAEWLIHLELYPDVPLPTYRALAEAAEDHFQELLAKAMQELGITDSAELPVDTALQIREQTERWVADLYQRALEKEWSARDVRDHLGKTKYERKVSTVEWIKDDSAEVRRVSPTGVGSADVTFRVGREPSGKVPDRVKITVKEVLEDD